MTSLFIDTYKLDKYTKILNLLNQNKEKKIQLRTQIKQKQVFSITRVSLNLCP